MTEPDWTEQVREWAKRQGVPAVHWYDLSLLVKRQRSDAVELHAAAALRAVANCAKLRGRLDIAMGLLQRAHPFLTGAEANGALRSRVLAAVEAFLDAGRVAKPEVGAGRRIADALRRWLRRRDRSSERGNERGRK